MNPQGRHIAYGGIDTGTEVSAAFATRAFGTSALQGKHLELTNATPAHPGYAARKAKKLWLMLQRGELNPAVVEDVKRRYARHFAQFARAQAKVPAA